MTRPLYRSRVGGLDPAPLLVTVLAAACVFGLGQVASHTVFRQSAAAREAARYAPFWDAIDHNNIAAVETWLKEPTNDPNFKNDAGKPAAFLAIERANLPLLRVLLKHPRFNPNATDAQGRTCLMWAVEADNLDAVKALLDQPKVNVAQRSEDGDELYLFSRTADMLSFLRTVPRLQEDETPSPPASEGLPKIVHMPVPSVARSLVIAETDDADWLLLDTPNCLSGPSDYSVSPRIVLASRIDPRRRDYSFGALDMWLSKDVNLAHRPDSHQVLGRYRFAILAGNDAVVFQYRDAPAPVTYDPGVFGDRTPEKLLEVLKRLNGLRFPMELVLKGGRRAYAFSPPLVSNNALSFFDALLRSGEETDVSDPANQEKQVERETRFREEFARFLNRRLRQWAQPSGLPIGTLYSVTADPPQPGTKPPVSLTAPSHYFYRISLWPQERNYARYADECLKDPATSAEDALALRRAVNGLLFDILLHDDGSSTKRRPSTLMLEVTSPGPGEALRTRPELTQSPQPDPSIISWLRKLCTGSDLIFVDRDTRREVARARIAPQVFGQVLPPSVRAEVTQGGETAAVDASIRTKVLFIPTKPKGGDLLVLWRDMYGFTVGIVEPDASRKVSTAIQLKEASP